MTLPRRLVIAGDRLLTPPLEAVDSLRRRPLASEGLKSAGIIPPPPGAVELILDLDRPGAALELAFDYPAETVGLRLDGDGLEFLHGPSRPRYLARDARPSRVRCFFDGGSIEVFADGGRWAGTRRRPHNQPLGGIRVISGAGAIRSAEGWELSL
jgi:beta-fructofuranosidase